MNRRTLAALTTSLIIAAVPLVQPALAQTAPERSDLGFIIAVREGFDADVVAREHAATYGFRVSHVYDAALNGYAGDLDPRLVERVRADPRVEVVQPNLRIS